MRWDGRRGWYEVWYVVVAGTLWLRYTLAVPSDQARDGEAALWLATSFGEPVVRKTSFPLSELEGQWPIRIGPASLSDSGAEGLGWSLRFGRDAGAPFEYVHPLLRRAARTEVAVARPWLEVSGTVDGHVLESLPGSQAHVWGTRHADRFGWAHAALPDGRFVELASARQRGRPRFSVAATERGVANGPLAVFGTRARAEPGRLRLGSFVVECIPDDAVGVTYRDPDGAPLYCYHSDRARLSGPGVSADGVSLEYASREQVPGWPLTL